MEEMAVAVVAAILERLSPFLYEAGGSCFSYLGQKVKLVASVEKEIPKLQRDFESILALLDDAEEKQNKDRSIKLWLNRLEELCYDMEQVLDEWNTLRLKMQIDGGADQTGASSHSLGKVRFLISRFSSPDKVVDRSDIAEKVKDICERLDVIVKEKDVYNLAARYIDRYAREVESNPSKKRRIESTAFAGLSKLHGRDDVKEQVVSSLLGGSSTDDRDSDVKTISVVGIGGMGKTALAQLICNDSEVKTYFDEIIWVCVSEDFDFVGVVKAILGSLNRDLAQNLDSLTLQVLLKRICKSIEGKKVLLVLDDVWTEEGNIWESLKQAFVAAAPGSRILVTTRKDRVAETMNSFRRFPLEGLNDEVCWKILRQEAFIGRGEDQCKILEDTGRKIAAKCWGLPLAARTLGGMLRFKKTRRDWEDVFNSDIWRLELIEQEVFAPLLLSYYDLPSPIRRCFSYCSVMPKDHLINREDLIREWMAQGYISSIEYPEMETIGDEYFECLVARSFFQDFKNDEEGRVSKCKMHDILVDFARFLMGNEFVFKDLYNADDENSQSRSIEEKTRHLTVMLDEKKRYLPRRMLFGVEKLRSIKLYDKGRAKSSPNLLRLCMQQKHLRSLNGFLDELPKEVGKLIHLRQLDLTGICCLKELPEEICDLCNLQSLDVKGCYCMEKLPSKMEKLINLRHLDTSGCIDLKSYSKGIGRLTSLRTLLGVVVRCDRNDDKEFSLGDLGNLCHLRSLFLMQMDGDSIDAGESERANLRGKKHLAKLEVVIPSSMDAGDVIKVLNLSTSTVVHDRTIAWVCWKN